MKKKILSRVLFGDFFLHFWPVLQALSICKNSFLIWIGLKKKWWKNVKIEKKCLYGQIDHWPGQGWSWCILFVKTCSQMVRNGRGWSFSGHFKKIDFFGHLSTWVNRSGLSQKWKKRLKLYIPGSFVPKIV